MAIIGAIVILVHDTGKTTLGTRPLSNGLLPEGLICTDTKDIDRSHLSQKISGIVDRLRRIPARG